MHTQASRFFAILLLVTPAIASARLFGPRYTMSDVNYSLSIGNYNQAAQRLARCAGDPRNRDSKACEKRLIELGSDVSIEHALRNEANVSPEQRRQMQEQKLQEMTAARVASLRASNDPWDKYILFSELSAGTISPLDSDEPARVAREAFEGFGECAKTTEPSCMGMYGELILRGTTSLDGKARDEARRKALYWLKLSARYAYDPARKALVSEGEDIPTPDLAMEQLQRQANEVARDSVAAQERLRRDQAIHHYETVREQRRQTEVMIWANLFPKMVSCTSSTAGTYTYTNCR